MRARDCERVPPANKLFFHDFRLRSIEKFAPECFFDFGIAARDRIADDHAVRRGREMFALESLRDVDAERLKHRRHRRIDVLIRSGNVMAARLKHTGERSHFILSLAGEKENNPRRTEGEKAKGRKYMGNIHGGGSRLFFAPGRTIS